MLKECWYWKGRWGREGGSTLSYRPRYGHRVQLAAMIIYDRTFGVPPEGYHIHHLCKNSWCVNPAHLVAVDPYLHKQFHKDP